MMKDNEWMSCIAMGYGPEQQNTSSMFVYIEIGACVLQLFPEKTPFHKSSKISESWLRLVYVYLCEIYKPFEISRQKNFAVGWLWWHLCIAFISFILVTFFFSVALESLMY